MRHLLLLIALILVSLGAVRAPQAGQLYGVDNGSPDQLVTVDSGSGNATAVGPLGFDALPTGLAHDPNSDTLYGSDKISDQLLEYDTATGVATPIGPLGFGSVDGLAFDPNSNILYGVDANVSRLLTIDTTTGSATIVGGSIGVSGVGGLAYDSTSDTLYGTEQGFNAQLLIFDTTTGAASDVGPLSGFTNLNGFAYDADADKLYATDTNGDQLVEVDAATGAVTVIGSLGFPFVASLASIPEPPLATCTMLMTAGYKSGSINIDIEIGTPGPATWLVGAYVFSSGAWVPFWTIPVPVIDPPLVLAPISLPVPPVGQVLLVSGVSGPGFDACWAFALVDTSP